MKITKKIMSVILSLALVVGMIGFIPMKAKAQEAEYPTWDLTEPFEVTNEEEHVPVVVSVSVAEEGIYKFYSTKEYSDPYVNVIFPDESEKYIDDVNGNDFEVLIFMKPGENYIFKFGNFHANGQYFVHCENVTIKDITLSPDETGTSIYEGENASTYVDGNGEEYYHYPVDDYANDIYMQVIFSDRTEEYSLNHLTSMAISCEIIDDQAGNHWTVGGDNFIRVSVLDKEIKIPVEIKAKPFVSFQVTQSPIGKYWMEDGMYIWSNENDEEYSFNPSRYNGLEIEATLKDGTTQTYTYKELLSVVGRYNIRSETITISGPGTYEANLCILDMSDTYSVEATDVSIAKPISSNENYLVTDEDGYQWFKLTVDTESEYRFYIAPSGDNEIEVVTYIYDEYMNHMAEFGSNDEECDYNTTLEGGTTYYFRTTTNAYNEGFTFQVKEKSVPKKIELLGGNVEVEINTKGYSMDDEDGRYFRYSPEVIIADRLIRVTYSDNSIAEFKYREQPEDIYVNLYSNQDNLHWTTTSKNFIYMECAGVRIEIPVKIVLPKTTAIRQDVEYTYNAKDPVYYAFTPSQSGMYKFYSYNLEDADSFVHLYDSSFVELAYDDSGEGLAFALMAELEAGKTYYYGVHYYDDGNPPFNIKIVHQKQATNLRIVSGSVEVIEDVDGQMWGEDEGDAYFRYTYEKIYDMVFELTLDDGSKHLLKLYEEVEGIALEHYDDQGKEPWHRGGENYVTVSWLNKSILVPVTIVENPVVGISFVNGTETPEYILGDRDYMWPNEDMEYMLYAGKLAGLQLKVDYRDGSSKTFTLDDEGKIGNYYVDTRMIFVDTVGEYTATYAYMANECTLPVRVVESPVAFLEIVKEPTVTTIPYAAEPSFAGMEFKIGYVDGTEKIIVVTEDMLEFEMYSSQITIVSGDIKILGEVYASTEESVAWNFHCYGVDTRYEGIKVLPERVTKIQATNITPDGVGMKIHVTYSDGTKKDYTVDPIWKTKVGDYIYGYMHVDGALIYYDVYIRKCHPNGVPCSGGVNAFGTYVDIDDSHKMTFVPAKAATCTTDGNKAYYKCSCGQLFADQAGNTALTAAQVKVAKHTVKYVKAVKATSKKNGNKAYYKCSCGKLYLDAACKKQVSLGDVTLAVVDKPSISKVTAKKKALTVKWKKKSGVTGYEVQVSLKKNFKAIAKKATVKGAKKVTTTIKSLKAKKTYYVRVRAYKTVNGKKFYSKWSKVLKKKTK